MLPQQEISRPFGHEPARPHMRYQKVERHLMMHKLTVGQTIKVSKMDTFWRALAALSQAGLARGGD
jgi:hypothetical protein